MDLSVVKVLYLRGLPILVEPLFIDAIIKNKHVIMIPIVNGDIVI